ncbi:MAG TPA: hypothetical protein VN765_12310 [Candidatus Acidoferrum sp.]|nr:hypothetical protein [Candidatus Acidoferrum sp.]
MTSILTLAFPADAGPGILPDIRDAGGLPFHGENCNRIRNWPQEIAEATEKEGLGRGMVGGKSRGERVFAADFTDFTDGEFFGRKKAQRAEKKDGFCGQAVLMLRPSNSEFAETTKPQESCKSED